MATWLVLGFAFSGLAIRYSEWFLIPLFLTLVLVGLVSFSLRCPKCKKSALNNPITVFGVEMYIWTSWIPKNCTHCGEPL